MARFLISPGVITREVDNSQYTATTTGLDNMAALVGYAEKGPFEPTIVSGTSDFVEKFGKTLANAPYLAQAAYKYFEENDNLLVMRAGKNQDPEAYPNAAQYSSLKVRLSPTDTTASAGYQTFSKNGNVASGTFSGGASYGFKVLTDFRAFTAPKYLEAWKGKAVETYSSLGTAPFTSSENVSFKVALPSSDSKSFVANSKGKYSTGGTIEYYGSGTRSGSSYGDSVNSTLYNYRMNTNYENLATDFIRMEGFYRANVVGTENLNDGYDFSTANKSFKVTLGTTQYTITLDGDTSAAELVTNLINAKLVLADDGVGGIVDISDKLEAVTMKDTVTESYIMLKKISSDGTGFTLSAGDDDALAILGWEAETYLDTKGIVGEWFSESDISGTIENFNGVFAYNLASTEDSALSFEEWVDVSIQAPISGDWELTDIQNKINAELAIAFDGQHTSDGYDYYHTAARGIASINSSNKIQITANEVAGEFGSIVRIEQPDGNSLITLLEGVDSYKDGIYPSSIGDALYEIKAKEKGSYGQNLIFRTETQKVNIGTQQKTYYNIYVLLNGYEVSVYQKVTWEDPDDENFFITRMADDSYIAIEADDEDEDATYAQIPDGDWKLGQSEIPEGLDVSDVDIVDYTVGTNGWTEESGIITSMSADFKNAILKLYNPEVYEFNLIAAPGSADPIVQNAIQDICDSRKDCFGIVDAAPYGLGLGIKEGLNDISEITSACSTINSSYVGAFWPWLQDYDSDNEQYIWLPPSIYALKSMVYTDSVADPWYAPAGTTRGKVSALDVEYSPSRTDRDLLYGDTNIVNPIVYFVSEGITIWGQKTGQRTLTSTNRINVRRLLIYAEKLIAKMARGFLFEPNDSAQWAAFTRQANAILEPIRQRRGLYEYTVQCDETTNTSDLIDQNIMAGKIFVQPTKTTEFIEVEFTINSSGDVEVTE